MDIQVEKTVKKDFIEWIQTLDDEKVLYILHDIKERNRETTPEEKEEFNQWLSKLDYEPQLEMLRSIIASSPDRDAIWDELSPEAQENLHTDEEIKLTDIKHIPERFWDLVRDLKKGEELSRRDLSEAEKEGIERGRADIKAGRTTPHEEVMKEVNQWVNDMKVKQMKKDIPGLPEDMRAEIADFVLETLNQTNQKKTP